MVNITFKRPHDLDGTRSPDGANRSDNDDTPCPVEAVTVPSAPEARPRIGKRPSLEDRLASLGSLSPSCKAGPLRTELPVRRKLFLEEGLTKNLLGHLNVGSADALALMIVIFDFHDVDKELLTKYIDDRSPENLKALQRQIKRLPAARGPAAAQ